MAQPHKGDRMLVGTRVPTPVHRILKSQAEARGISLSEYASWVLAHYHDRDDLVPAIPEAPDQPATFDDLTTEARTA